MNGSRAFFAWASASSLERNPAARCERDGHKQKWMLELLPLTAADCASTSETTSKNQRKSKFAYRTTGGQTAPLPGITRYSIPVHTRGRADPVAQVRSVRASSIPLPRGSRTARCAGRGDRGNGTHHSAASAKYRASIAHASRTQRHDHRRARHTSAGRVFRRAKMTWLSGAQDAPNSKSPSTIRLIDYSSRSSRKPTIFWCRTGTPDRRRPRQGV